MHKPIQVVIGTFMASLRAFMQGSDIEIRATEKEVIFGGEKVADILPGGRLADVNYQSLNAIKMAAVYWAANQSKEDKS